MNTRSPKQTASLPRRILLLDCDQFFVQCARLADPEGAGRQALLLVGGTADGRGVVTSASYETRAFGVRSGMPTAQALRLCPRAAVVPVPRAICGERSRAIRDVLEQFSPIVEPASIDEAYLDLTGTEALYRDAPLAEIARRIQSAVLEQTAIVVSIGGGASKIVARMAAGRAKPAGVHIVPAGAEVDFLRGFRLDDIPGVGPVVAAELQWLGMVTVEDALRHERATLEAWLGASRGGWLYRRVHGEDGSAVESQRETRQLSREETFPRDLEDDAALQTELLALCVRLGSDLRGEGLRARTVSVKLRDHDFVTRTAAHTTPGGIESDRALYGVARDLLARLRERRRVPARLIGVAASHFLGGPATQLTLFEESARAPVETDRDRRLSRATDDLRRRFGPGAIRPGGLIDR
jgi:DNA polymerase IV